MPHLLDIRHGNKSKILPAFKVITAVKPDRLQHTGGASRWVAKLLCNTERTTALDHSDEVFLLKAVCMATGRLTC